MINTCFCCFDGSVHYDSHLLIYSETHVDVLDCSTGDWIQTLNLKRCRPLTSNGLLSACFATEQPYVVYLRNTNKGKSALNGRVLKSPASIKLSFVTLIKISNNKTGRNLRSDSE